MNKAAAEVLLKFLNVPSTGLRGDWLLSRCPWGPWNHSEGLDHHPSFGIKTSPTKKSIFKCMSCGEGGDLGDLILGLGLKLKKDPKPGYKMVEAAILVANELSDIELDLLDIPDFSEGAWANKQDTVFTQLWLNSFKPVTLFPEAMDYVLWRGVTVPMIKHLDIRYDPTQQRVCFPFRNFKGELMGVQGRDINQHTTLRYYQYDFKKRHNLHIWMGEDTVDFDKPVVVTEGPFDLTSIMKAYKNVLCSFTSGLAVEKVKRLADAVSIVTFYDHGKGGDSARARLKKILPQVPMEHIIPSEEEDDAGNCHPAVIREYLEDYVKLLPKDSWK